MLDPILAILSETAKSKKLFKSLNLEMICDKIYASVKSLYSVMQLASQEVSKLEINVTTNLDRLKEYTAENWFNKIILADCGSVLHQMPSDVIDLIITSPPYADSRKKTYGGIHPDDYVNWFLPIANELKRVLKPSGTFIFNIKEKVVDGERHPYVLNLILEMQKQGWLWTEEYIWHKKNSYPGKWSNRFRDAWERCLQFNKQKKFKMYQESVMVPMGDWAKSRLKNLSETDKKRDNSKVESGFGKNVSNWLGRDLVYPTNVLHLATECGNKRHSAAFPKALPSWFIKLFSEPGDVVLDPFVGSGTTCIAAKELSRYYIGIELQKDYCELAVSNINKTKYNIQVKETITRPEDELVNSQSQIHSMSESPYKLYHDYLEKQVLTPFYEKRFEKIRKLSLKKILKSKNPYLFKAKNIEVAGDLVKSVVDAFLSYQEETIFGNLLESFAIYVSKTIDGGFKSKLKSVDLEFEREETYYIVGIKSGTKWGNSDQINAMKNNFKKAREILRKQGIEKEIKAINGCIYGKDSKPLKKDEQDQEKTYYKYAGQEFWNFISGDDNLYQEIIVPIDKEAKKKDETFKTVYDSKVNEMTYDFMRYFLKNNQIDWVKLIDYVSKKEEIDLDASINQKQMELNFDSEQDEDEILDFSDLSDTEQL